MSSFTIRSKELFSTWLRDVISRSGLTKAEFATRLYQITDKKIIDSSGKVIIRKKTGFYSRNSVSNWLNLGSDIVPKSIATIVHIALIDYTHPKRKRDLLPVEWARQSSITSYITENSEEREEQFSHVCRCLSEYTTFIFYSKNLEDALLMLVALGVIDFEELCRTWNRFQSHEENLKNKQNIRKRSLRFRRNTETMYTDLMRITDRNGIEAFIHQYIGEISLGPGVMGERLEQIFTCTAIPRFINRQGKENEMEGARRISSQKGVEILAPREAHDTRMKQATIGVTREWLIRHLIALRFTREEINDLLRSQSMSGLLEDGDSLEGMIGTDNGSPAWYRKISGISGVDGMRYPKLTKVALRTKVVYSILMLAYLRGKKTRYLLPFPYYFDCIFKCEERKPDGTDIHPFIADAEMILSKYSSEGGLDGNRLAYELKECADNLYGLVPEPVLAGNDYVLYDALLSEYDDIRLPESGVLSYPDGTDESVSRQAEDLFALFRYHCAFSHLLFTGYLYDVDKGARWMDAFKSELEKLAVGWKAEDLETMEMAGVFITASWRTGLFEKKVVAKNDAFCIKSWNDKLLCDLEYCIEIYAEIWQLIWRNRENVEE